jgi:hypothetical protein
LWWRGASGGAVVFHSAWALARSKERDRLRAYIRRHAAALREDTNDWGNVGHCFALLEDYRQAAEWMRDWPQRTDAQSWMLINLAISLRGLGDDVQANGVSLHALKTKPDYTTPYHRTWLALDEALAGNGDAARARLKDLDSASFDRTHQYVYRLIETMLKMQQASPPERAAAFVRARQELDEAARTLAPLKDDRLALRHVYRRCVRRLAHDRGSVAARLWSRWRCWRPLLPPAEIPSANGALASR